MLHTIDIHDRPEHASNDQRASCARCGGTMAVTRAGNVKQGVRYCSARCRTADVRDRRAAARADLLAALDDLRALETRVRAALAVMGHAKQ